MKTIDFGGPAWWQLAGNNLVAEVEVPRQGSEPPAFNLRSWDLATGKMEDLGTFDWPTGASNSCFGPMARSWLYARGDGVYARELPIRRGGSEKLIARHASDGVRVSHRRRPGGVYSSDSRGGVFVWTTDEWGGHPGRQLRRAGSAVVGHLRPDERCRWLISDDLNYETQGSSRLWDLNALPGARPLQLRRRPPGMMMTWWSDLQPHGGNWAVVAVGQGHEITFWPLTLPRPIIVDGFRSGEFTRDGRYLVSSDWDAERGTDALVRLWPLPGDEHNEIKDFKFPPRSGSVGHAVTADPSGSRLLAMSYAGVSFLLTADGTWVRNPFGFSESDLGWAGGFSPSGRLVAGANMIAETVPALIVRDLDSGEIRAFEQPVPSDPSLRYLITQLEFLNESTILTSGGNGLLRWNLDEGTFDEIVAVKEQQLVKMSLSQDRRKLLTWWSHLNGSRVPSSSKLHLLEEGRVETVEIPGEGYLGLGPLGEIWASGEPNGAILVGKVAGGDPHLLFGGSPSFKLPRISPDGQWIAASGPDYVLHLWPMPDLSKPPLHTLPHDELIAKLKSLTNLRAVRDDESATGWKIEVGPFPGWAEVPEW